MNHVKNVLLEEILFIIIVKNVDVSAIGPEGTSIGLSGINKDVHEATGLSLKWDDATDKLSYLAFMIGGVFALMGLLQLIARKSIAKDVIDSIKAMDVIFFDEYKFGAHDYTDEMAYNVDHLSTSGAKQYTHRLDSLLSTLKK